MKALNIFNDADLLKRLRQDDDQTFQSIFNLYFTPIRNNILQFISDKGAAEDIHQEVFITLWENRKQLPLDLKMKSWLFTVSYNKSISFLRKKDKILFTELNNDEISDEAWGHVDQQLHNIDSKRTLMKLGIKHLSPQRKKALMLYKIANYSYTDIAEEMNLSTQTVKQYVKMAMMFLRKYVQNNSFDFCLAIVLLSTVMADCGDLSNLIIC